MTDVIGPFTGEHAFLSNFYRAPFRVPEAPDVTFSTVEHYYQGCKAATFEQWRHVLDASTPGEAKKRGRKVTLNPDFEPAKKYVMLYGVLWKFRCNPELRDRLLRTAPAVLVESNTWGDRYWGQVDGQGENWLGRILMMAREVLS